MHGMLQVQRQAKALEEDTYRYLDSDGVGGAWIFERRDQRFKCDGHWQRHVG